MSGQERVRPTADGTSAGCGGLAVCEECATDPTRETLPPAPNALTNIVLDAIDAVHAGESPYQAAERAAERIRYVMRCPPLLPVQAGRRGAGSFATETRDIMEEDPA